jgi:hypothetical protein
MVIMLIPSNVHPSQFKVFQVFPHLIKDIPDTFNRHLEELVFSNYFFKRDADQRTEFDKLAAAMSKHESITVTVANEVDFEQPRSFEYVTENFTAFDFEVTMVEEEVDEMAPKGCECGAKKCGLASRCCPQLVGEPFAYRRSVDEQSIIRLGQQEAIIECGDACKCDATCTNRGTQQPRHFTLCLFKTEGGF